VRSLGSHIKGTNGKSQGVVPFLKVVNDTAVAVNQGGKRKGAVCAYLETWHLDVEEFLELRKNTGDDRRRTHDMNTANWIPDLFMKRVMEKGEWTLFTPSTCPDLHDKFGLEFEKAYLAYEQKAANGEIKPFKKVSALDMWRKMLGMLFETGHPWITFKDPCNVRSPQQHVGVVHSSNLCTEITLNTNETEIAVCNLGSVNLAVHLKADASGNLVLDHEKLQKTIRTAMRMLDNVWASWVSRIACTCCAFLTPVMQRFNLLMNLWKLFATTLTWPQQSWPKSAVLMRLTRVLCGIAASCHRIQ
jgi:ribonucleoside-diphosphate reductase alpha chain